MGARVDVFRVRPPAGASIDALESLLSAAERERAARYHRASDRALSITARALARLALAWRAGRQGRTVDPSRIAFGEETHGKPCVAAPAEALGLVFNVSHTEGLAVCAVATAGSVATVGVDVERVDRRASHADLARRFFAEPEAAAVVGAPEGTERRRLFFRLWTLKEAYLKARGVGLGVPLASFRFSLDGPEPSIAFAAGADDDASLWRFAQREVETVHVVAVAGRFLSSPVEVVFHPAGLPP